MIVTEMIKLIGAKLYGKPMIALAAYPITCIKIASSRREEAFITPGPALRMCCIISHIIARI